MARRHTKCKCLHCSVKTGTQIPVITRHHHLATLVRAALLAPDLAPVPGTAGARRPPRLGVPGVSVSWSKPVSWLFLSLNWHMMLHSWHNPDHKLCKRDKLCGVQPAVRYRRLYRTVYTMWHMWLSQGCTDISVADVDYLLTETSARIADDSQLVGAAIQQCCCQQSLSGRGPQPPCLTEWSGASPNSSNPCYHCRNGSTECCFLEATGKLLTQLTGRRLLVPLPMVNSFLHFQRERETLMMTDYCDHNSSSQKHSCKCTYQPLGCCMPVGLTLLP